MTTSQKSITVLFVAVFFVGVSAMLPFQENSPANAAATEKYKMVAGLDVVMPYVDEVFTTISEKIEADKLRSVKDDALFLAELMNLSTHSEDWNDKDGWTDLCGKATKGLVELSAAAKAKDKAKVTELFTKTEATCEKCHDDIRDA